jgi:hypothetical protein
MREKSVSQSGIFEVDLELGFRLESPRRFARDFFVSSFFIYSQILKNGVVC